MKDTKTKTATSATRPEDWGDRAQRFWDDEDALLEAAGFEPEETDLWTKGGVCYGRNAALQSARRG